MMNHINSYKRKALYGKSALDMAKAVLPEDFFLLLGIEEIPPEKIILRPSLIEKSQSNRNTCNGRCSYSDRVVFTIF